MFVHRATLGAQSIRNNSNETANERQVEVPKTFAESVERLLVFGAILKALVHVWKLLGLILIPHKLANDISNRKNRPGMHGQEATYKQDTGFLFHVSI